MAHQPFFLVTALLIFFLTTTAAFTQSGFEYVDPQYGFKITIPDGWNQGDKSEYDPEVIIEVFEDEESSMLMLIMHEEAKTVLSTNLLYPKAMDNFKNSFIEEVKGEEGSEVIELDRKLHQVNGLKVATLNLEYRIEDSSVMYRTRFIAADQQLYIISMLCLEEDFDEFEPIANQSLDSFIPKNPQSQEPNWRMVVMVIGGICCCGTVTMGGGIYLIVKLVKKK